MLLSLDLVFGIVGGIGFRGFFISFFLCFGIFYSFLGGKYREILVYNFFN